MDKGHGPKGSSYIALIVLMVIAFGCYYNHNYKGYEVPEKVSWDIWKLESDFCTSVIKKQNRAAYDLLSDSMAARYDTSHLDQAFYLIGRFLVDYPFAAQNIYYQKSTLDTPVVKVRFDDEEIKPFTISYRSNTAASAVTTAILGNGDIQSCLLIMFGQRANKWEIENVSIGYFLLDGKNAADWLTEAERWMEKKDYAMASYCANMCGWLIKPANAFWQYDNEAEMRGQMQKIYRKIQRNLQPPPQLASIDTKPEIMDMHAIVSNNKVYPGFVINTTLALNDSLAIEKECSKLDVVFASYFKNMDHDTIFVQVVHQDDYWTEPTSYVMKKRKLDKGLLTN